MGDYMREQFVKEVIAKKSKNTMAMRKARISTRFQFCYNPYTLEDPLTLLLRRVTGSILPVWGFHCCSDRFTDS